MVLFFRRADSAAFGEQGQKLSLLDEFFAYIKSSYEFSLTVDLGVGWPTAVVSEPVAHILVLNDVVKRELDLMLFENVKHGLGKPALRLACSSLYEYYDWRFAQNALDFGMPNFLLLLEVHSVGLGFLSQSVEDDSHVVGLEFFQFFFVSLGEEDSGSELDFILFECLWTFFGSQREILDIFELSEERNGGDEIFFELD